jgi:hypothetical protein
VLPGLDVGADGGFHGGFNGGWDAVFADIPALEFFDEDSGRLSGRLHACPTECNEDRLVWNDWQHHQVKRKRAADGDGTFGASDAYKVTFWGPTVGTRRLFFQHARRCLNDDVRHAWALHNHRTHREQAVQGRL